MLHFVLGKAGTRKTARACALGAAAMLVVAPAVPAPAASKPKTSHYTLTTASGVVKVTYEGTTAAGCESRGLCGVNGTVTYRFGGKPKSGEVDLIETSRPFGFGAFGTRGVTSASVRTPGAAACNDRVSHPADGFGLLQRGKTKMEFTFHSRDAESATNFLSTRCAGPRDTDIGSPLVKASLPLSIFRARRIAFTAKGNRPFRRGGFQGLATWNLAFKMTGARCNPNCADRRTPVSGQGD